MKKIYRDKIINIEKTNVFDNTFLFDYGINLKAPEEVTLVYMKDILSKKKNEDIIPKLKEKPAMWSEIYSPKDELEIFTELFEHAIQNKQKTHIVWVTLGEEIQILEAYYKELGFMREDINAFDVDFSKPLVTVSCHIENLIWRGSDYKARREKIFFCPPVRESWQNKALFKGITRWVIAGIELWDFTDEKQEFLTGCIKEEKIMPLHMWKVLRYNLDDIWFDTEISSFQIQY